MIEELNSRERAYIREKFLLAAVSSYRSRTRGSFRMAMDRVNAYRDTTKEPPRRAGRGI